MVGFKITPKDILEWYDGPVMFTAELPDNEGVGLAYLSEFLTDRSERYLMAKLSKDDWSLLSGSGLVLRSGFKNAQKIWQVDTGFRGAVSNIDVLTFSQIPLDAWPPAMPPVSLHNKITSSDMVSG